MTIIALNGVHTAGKSTLGERLRDTDGFNYYTEIAQQLIDEEEADWGEEGDNAFQSAIHERETCRDRDILQRNIDHALIETWHFGNIAHSMETAEPELVEEQQEYVQTLSEHSDVQHYAVFLDMPLEKIWERSPHFEHGDQDALAFYDAVKENHFQLYDEHDVEYIVVENNDSLDDAYEQVKEFVYEVTG